jgi:hypothetical protein
MAMSKFRIAIQWVVGFLSLAGLFLIVLSASAQQRASFLTPAGSTSPTVAMVAQPTVAPVQQPRAMDPPRRILAPPEQPAQLGQPTEPVVIDEAVPAPQSAAKASGELPAGAANVRPAPRIVFDTDSDAQRMYACFGSVDVIMVTQNPADKCFYEIPLCIPACCVGEPSVSSRYGLFGRGVVEYCWPCGFEAVVKFRNIGDVRVDYEGD